MKSKKGFTLLELLIVVIIIAILAAYAIPQFFGSVQKSYENTAQANLVELRKVQLAEQQTNGSFVAIAATNSPSHAVDIDGDGTVDVSVSFTDAEYSYTCTAGAAGAGATCTATPANANYTTYTINLDTGNIT